MKASKKEIKPKKGISLIVLVITIIVMIILAAAVIISLSNNGIINKANEAVDVTDEKQMQILAQTLWAEAYMDGKRDKELITAVETGLQAADSDYKSKYMLDISNTGVSLYKQQWDTVYEGNGQLIDGMLVVSEDDAVFNLAYKYKITLESESGSNLEVIGDYILIEAGTYMLGIIANDEPVKYSSMEEYLEVLPPLLENGNDVIVINGENQTDGTNKSSKISLIDITGGTVEYKITKVEKMKVNNDINEYNFYYNKWYKASGELDGETIEGNIYFNSDKTVYIRYNIGSSGGTTVGIWSTDASTNSIVVTINYIDEISNKINSFSVFTLEQLKLIETEDIYSLDEEKIKVSKNELGVYTDAIYVAKDVTKLGIDVTTASLNISGDFVFKSIVKTDGTVSGNPLSSYGTFNLDDYTVSSDGKTIIDKTGEIEIEYVLVEEPYQLK